MAVIDIPVVGPHSNIPQDDPQRTLNFYAEKSGDVLTLKPTPGALAAFNLAVNGGGRGAFSLGGRLFGVRGAFFQEIVNGVPVIRGTLSSTQGALEISGALPPDGSGQVIIVDQEHGYVFEFSGDTFTTLTEATHGFVGGLSQVVVTGGYAVAIKPGTNQVGFSSLYNFLDWPGINFFTAESTKGNLVALASTGSTVYLFTDSGFEGWTTEGYTPPFAFTLAVRDFQVGCMAPASLVSFDRWIYWLGGNEAGKGVVYTYTQGGVPQRISDHAIERQIAALDNQEDAVGYCYQSLGHTFYIMSFVTGNMTLAWDRTTKLWHERAWRDNLTNYMFAVPYVTVIIHDGVLLGLDRRNGRFFEVSNTTFTDDGAPVRRERTFSVIPEEADWQTVCSSVELFAETGNTPVGQDDPQIMLKYSIDRGKTWGQELWQQAGGNGSYAARTRWTGLGAGFGFVFNFATECNQFVSWRKIRMDAQ